MELVIGGTLFCWAAVLSYSDIRVKKLPNSLTLPVLIVVALIAVVQQDWLAVLGGSSWFLLYLAVAAFSSGIGGGDIKLAPTLGLLIGSGGLIPVLGAIAGAQIFSIATSLIMRENRHPHGPAMLVATAIVWILIPHARLL